MKIELVEDWKEVWKMSSARVQAMFLTLVGVWLQMPPEYRQSIMDMIGLTAERMLFVTAVAWAISTFAARSTRVTLNGDPAAPTGPGDVG
jgi:hypothetical protein